MKGQVPRGNAHAVDDSAATSERAHEDVGTVGCALNDRVWSQYSITLEELRNVQSTDLKHTQGDRKYAAAAVVNGYDAEFQEYIQVKEIKHKSIFQVFPFNFEIIVNTHVW